MTATSRPAARRGRPWRTAAAVLDQMHEGHRMGAPLDSGPRSSRPPQSILAERFAHCRHPRLSWDRARL